MLAAAFADKFGAADYGFAAGFLHDMGKAKQAFQRKLQGEINSEPHSGEGARFAVEHYAVQMPRPFGAPLGRMLAFAIAGHHCGLANGQASGSGLSPLKDRLQEAGKIDLWFDEKILPDLAKVPPLPLQRNISDPFAVGFFVRMLFSALVDADRLATERWFARIKNEEVKRGWQGDLSSLKAALDAHLHKFGPPRNDLAKLRAEVLDDCRRAGSKKPGLFSLSVPTGGGKTLSSLAFALEHAIHHNLDRVIYVIPFTSIVEQTAQVFREALGDEDAILEHHSSFDTERLESSNREDDLEKMRLAAQNWDRPIIVTTAVQFFESLFANRPGRCRKLHNMARAVIILDEAQTLPLKLLRPCLAAMKELQKGYGASIVLCTATQPAVTGEQGLLAIEAFEGVKPVISPNRNLFKRLKRVRTRQAGVMSDDDLAREMGAVSGGLCIVNNRRHARELSEHLQKAGIEGARHLSTSMTAAHRRLVLAEIRKELAAGKPVRLVSTSLIEAGVDISFGAVWRAWAGLDQITQAAGRCNRENELGREGGLLTIFQPEEAEGHRPPPELKSFAETAQRVLTNGPFDDPLGEEAVAAYFRELIWLKSGNDHNRPKQLDKAEVGEDQPKIMGIMKALEQSAHGLNFRFADIANAFRMIESHMVPIIIPETDKTPGISKELAGRLRVMDKAGGVFRDLQPHLVQIPRMARAALYEARAVKVIQPKKFGDQFVLLTSPDLYTPATGLKWDDPSFRKAESNMF